MQFFVSFLEGIITFISPCLLPMLPIYVSYFTGGSIRSVRKTVCTSIAFVLGFSCVFIAMGALAGVIGSFLTKYQIAVNIISGIIVIIFGLNYLGVFNLGIFRSSNRSINIKDLNFISAFLFGIVFSVGWTPCVGAFLGSALMLASQQGHMLTGVLMLLCYSLGLGIPFVLSAVLIDKLKAAFIFIKQNYGVINIVCGCLLILVGILMATGVLGRFLTVLG